MIRDTEGKGGRENRAEKEWEGEKCYWRKTKKGKGEI